MLPPEDSALYARHFPEAGIEIVDIDHDDTQPRLSTLSTATTLSATTVSESLTAEEEALVVQLSSARMRLSESQGRQAELVQRVQELEREGRLAKEALREKEAMVGSLTLSFKNQNETIRLLQQTLQAMRAEQTHLLLRDSEETEKDVVIRVKASQTAIVLARDGRITGSGLRELRETIREYDSEVAAYRTNCDFWRKQLEVARKRIKRMEDLKGRMEQVLQEKESQLGTCYKSIRDSHHSE